MSEIYVTCDVKNRVHWSKLIPIQGELKSLSRYSYEKLKRSILKHGIHSPCYVWEEPSSLELKLLDGTQRRRTYEEMEKEGYKIPHVPIVKIDAPDLKTAQQILLTLVSQYGKLSDQGLYEYSLEAGLSVEDLKEYDLSLDMNKFEKEFFNTELEDVDADMPDAPSEVECPHCGEFFTP